MRRAQLLIAASGALLLSGCATLGGNVKGDFQCSAPGGTCAPTSTIDDQAISSMTSDASVKQSPSAETDGADAINRYLVVPGSATALKVVLPAQQDREGHWRNQSVVYVEGAAPLQAAGDTAPVAPRLSLSDLAAGAPEIAMFDTAQPITTADIRRKVEATLAASSPSIATRSVRTPVITLPVESSQKLAPVAPAAAVVAGPSLPAPDSEDQ